MHYRMPYVRMIAWDIALDESNIPMLIECNFCGYYQISEAVNGPVFGELLDKMLDQWLLTYFNFEFATSEFRCKEYHNRVVITEYIGNSEQVLIPSSLRGKPVTKVEDKAFDGYKNLQVIVTDELYNKSKKAFDRITTNTIDQVYVTIDSSNKKSNNKDNLRFIIRRDIEAESKLPMPSNLWTSFLKGSGCRRGEESPGGRDRRCWLRAGWCRNRLR